MRSATVRETVSEQSVYRSVDGQSTAKRAVSQQPSGQSTVCQLGESNPSHLQTELHTCVEKNQPMPSRPASPIPASTKHTSHLPIAQHACRHALGCISVHNCMHCTLVHMCVYAYTHVCMNASVYACIRNMLSCMHGTCRAIYRW